MSEESSPSLMVVTTIPCTVPSTHRSPTESQVDSSASTSPLISSSGGRSSAFSSNSSLRKNSSFLDGGARDVLAPTECGFPVPKKGQTLYDFLSSSDFNSFMSPLDKENAHFYIAEVVIQAMEHFQCWKRSRKNVTARNISKSEFERESTPEACLRTRRKRRESCRMQLSVSEDMTASNKDCTASLSLSSSDHDEGEFDSISKASFRSIESQAPMSAERTALCLLRNFRDKPLLKASDLKWIVGNDETPQQMIVLPDSWAVSPDDSSNNIRKRGSEFWAPPRKQIIFNKIFAESTVKIALEKQNLRCAGCGMKMLPKTSRPRLCHYLGKHFCQTCHHNYKSVIPARIVLKWDFTQCPVSDFAKNLLESLYCDPVFELYEYHRTVLKKSRMLAKVTELRGTLMKSAQYVKSCKNANKTRLLRIPIHLYTDQFKYSLDDFIQARNGELLRALQQTHEACVNHVRTCQLCRGQGFVCEYCRRGDAIFPFDTQTVVQCQACNACFHLTCVMKGPFSCGKCERIRQR
ncbi:run domain Beclin-1-interacting and cysteine-rich domain-containing protein-like isoform X1 [Varroa destructor]|uniref:Phorbol-ester/DAG-type domain-containing protein n=1 Tax=Varroa destructor TaxID=109461 RepID=A0A7M7JE87_VARDE|nr:run domain Beclin-1-interacting and cysteine-rich domain-containing protein-like isoform X1 [Varroa destructor]